MIALGCLEVALDRGEDNDWLGSGYIRVLFIASALALLFGIPYLLTVRHPVVNLRAFKDRNFAIGWVQIALMGFVLYASAVLVPTVRAATDRLYGDPWPVSFSRREPVS